MHKRKLITIVLMLACTVAAVVGNWEYWVKTVGGGERASSPSGDALRSSEAASRTGPGSEARPVETEPPVARKQEERNQEPPQMQVDDPDKLLQVARLLRERLVPEPRPASTDDSITHSFKHPLELASGVHFADLVQQLKSNQGSAVGTSVIPTRPGTSPEEIARREAEMERARLSEATVTAIVKGHGWATCVIGGHRLSIGDAYPGTTYTITAITTHAAHLKRGGECVQKNLMKIGGSKPRAKKGESR